jgi:hypothetical protein
MKRTAERARCRVCRRYVWTGPDADFAALIVTVDETPLDAYGEALAALDDRGRYELIGGELRTRAPWSVRRRHPGDPYLRRGHLQLVTVLAEHRCGRPMPGAPASPYWTTMPIPRPRPPDRYDQPPY